MRFRPSLRWLSTALVVGPTIVAAGILLWLSATATRRISEDLGSQLAAAASTSVEKQVESYLAGAVRLSDLYVQRLSRGTLAAKDLAAWKLPLLDDINTHYHVASVCFANLDGDTTWLLRAHGRLEFGLVDGKRNGAAIEHAIEPKTGELSAQPLRTYQYLAQERPWYQAARQAKTPVWTPIYSWFAETDAPDDAAETGTGYTREVFDKDGKLLGVLVVDVTLGGLSQFLHQIPLAQKGSVFIVDDRERLVAASHGRVISPRGERIPLTESGAPVTTAVEKALSTIQPLGVRNGATRLTRIDTQGEPARLSVNHLNPYQGIDWRVLIVVPEREFMARAELLRERSLGLATLVAALSVILGLWFSQRLTKPLLVLGRHVRRVAEGDFQSRVELRSSRELDQLSTELNAMTAGLQERMELERALGLAMDVQQCLLPEQTPKVVGFDVASRNRYCDATGGDYFDFLEIAEQPPRQLFVALGDVSGHGIASALIMASARAALRAYAAEDRDLAVLLTKVNRAFSVDSRHGRFMTLALLSVDGDTRRVRWASAGHDPTIVYDPTTDSFFELDGGDLPMGVVEENEYEEYRRDGLCDRTVMLLGTDGVWEMANEHGEAYGKERLRDVLRKSHALSADEIAAAVDADLDAFRGAAPVYDDVTFVIIKLLA